MKLEYFARELGPRFGLVPVKVNDNAYTLWDSVEAVVSLVQKDGTTGIGFSMGLDKLVIATIAMEAAKIYPEVILTTPFYFDYRDQTLYRNAEAVNKSKDADFYYKLQSMAFN